MKKINIAFSIFFIIVSCNSSKGKDLGLFQERMSEKLHEWGFSANLSFKENDSEGLEIDIYFLKRNQNSLNSYFLDEESNKMIIAMLNHSFYEDLKGHAPITYNLNFEEEKDLKDFEVVISSKELLESHSEFKESPVFFNFVEYAFKEIGAVDIVRANAWIDYLNEESELFNFEGSFWKLLHGFSSACDNPKENLKSVYLFIAFTGLVADPENPRDDDIDQRNLVHYIKSCGFEEDLVYLPLPDLINALSERYDN